MLVHNSTFINFADERTALYGTVGVVKITEALYSCSSRWLKTSICKSPRNPNLGGEKAKLQNVYVSWALVSLMNIVLLSGRWVESKVIQKKKKKSLKQFT